MIEVAGREALLDVRPAAFDGDAMCAGYGRGERLRTPHVAEAGGKDPLAAQVPFMMLAAHFGEGFERALHDALHADVDPAARGHLAVHHQPGAIERVEMLLGCPLRH